MDILKYIPGKPAPVKVANNLKKTQDAYDKITCAGSVDSSDRNKAAACDSEVEDILKEKNIKSGAIRATGTQLDEAGAKDALDAVEGGLNKTAEGAACADMYSFPSIIPNAKDRAM